MDSLADRARQLDLYSPVIQVIYNLLIKSGYCDVGLSPTPENVVPAIPKEIAAGSPLLTLLKFFYAQEPVAPEILQEALGTLKLERVLSTGFCSLEENQVVPNVFIQPYGKLLFAVPVRTRLTGPENMVMQISGTTLDLANIVTPGRVRTALDLGTGCGFLASQLASHAERVYALDLNSIAVQFAELNARWNSVSNMTCLQGDLFEPVRGIRFDLIVSNPPFFICPVPDSAEHKILFQHSGVEGDSFALNLAREGAQFLNEGGFLHMILSWMQGEKQDWHARLAGAFSDLGCDAWCFRTEAQSAEEYVSFWCRNLPDAENLDLDAFRQSGLEYFQKKKIASIGTGLLTLHRGTTRPNHVWFDDAPEDRSEPYGSAIAALFDLRAKFDGVPDESFLQQRFKAAPDIASIQKSACKGGRWELIAAELCRDSGLKYTFSGVDPVLSEIVMRLDGRVSLREVLARVSRARRLPVSRVLSKYLPLVRKLLEYGFILPASGARRAIKELKSARTSSR